MTADPRSDPTSDPAAARLPVLLRGLPRALGLAWRSGPLLIIGVALLAALSAMLPVAVAWLTKLSLEAVTHSRSVGMGLPAIGAGLVAAGLAAAVVPSATRYLRLQLGRRSAAYAQDVLFRATERFVGLARFEDPVFLDRLRLAQQSGGSAPGDLVGGALTIVGGVITLTGFLGSLLAINAWMAALVSAAAAPALVAQLWISRRRAATAWQVGPFERREFCYQQVLTSVQAAKEMRLFAAGGYLRELMNADRRNANAHYERVDRRELWGQVALAGLAAAIAGIGLVWALNAAWHGRISVGDVSLFVASAAGVQATLTSLVSEIAGGHQRLTMFGHYLAVVDSPVDLAVPPAPRAVSPLREGIELRDVWFRYAPDQPWILRGVSLSIRRGQATALVGANGAGKTTIVKLLCRLYDPQRGSITWDGVDLRELDPVSLRARMSAVFQDFMRYDLTAAVNVGLGDVSALDEPARIEEAARLAGVHQTLQALPDGYDTLLSRLFFSGDAIQAKVGVSLSGGQWQRVALARAMLRGGRDVLLLDEPSSGLDPEAEYEIHADLLRHRTGRTSVLISHRLGAVRDADVLLVLDRGQVVERGRHDELVEAGGRYARLFAMQAEGYQPCQSL